MADRPPSEIARETLKQLAARRLPPTPDNYLALYDEIAGVRSPQPFPEGPLHQILRVLPGQTPAQKRLLGQFERAVNQLIAESDQRRSSEPFRTPTFSMGRPTVDLDRALPLAAELEDEELLRKARSGR